MLLRWFAACLLVAATAPVGAVTITSRIAGPGGGWNGSAKALPGSFEIVVID